MSNLFDVAEPAIVDYQGHRYDLPGQKGRPKFNRTNENVSWASWTWNPVTGCLHGCAYCYARDIAEPPSKSFPAGFRPIYRPDRLEAPWHTKPPRPASQTDRQVFVCSMADLFGDWVPDEWITSILEVVAGTPEWTYLFLTKNPKRLPEFDYPGNAWIGTTVDCQARVKPAEEAMASVVAPVRWLSVEPMQEPVLLQRPELFDLVAIGAGSKTKHTPAIIPAAPWVTDLQRQVKRCGGAIWIKHNLNHLAGITVERALPGGQHGI